VPRVVRRSAHAALRVSVMTFKDRLAVVGETSRFHALTRAYLDVQKRAILTITPSSKRRTIAE
jgi:hypothetical protein